MLLPGLEAEADCPVRTKISKSCAVFTCVLLVCVVPEMLPENDCMYTYNQVNQHRCHSQRD